MSSKASPLSISVCVIGRNEEENLGRLFESLRPLRRRVSDVEKIYVDSASEDRSIEAALGEADLVVRLKTSPNLSAAAGRNVGTTSANGTWILYLDADMVLEPEFIDHLVNLTPEEESSGWVGQRKDIYEDGTVRNHVLSLGPRGSVVRHFGGAVLLPRDQVLAAGNWNPRLFAYEEIDLHSRLRRAGCFVKSAELPMVEHHTRRIPRSEKLKNILSPQQGHNKRFYGFGQVLAANRKPSQRANLVRQFPDPFVFWGCMSLATVLAGMKRWPFALVVAAIGSGYTWKTKGFRFIAVYAAFGLQAVAGYRKYDVTYTPEIEYTRFTIGVP